MREKQNEPFQLSFNAALKVDFLGSRVNLRWRSHSGTREGVAGRILNYAKKPKMEIPVTNSMRLHKHLIDPAKPSLHDVAVGPLSMGSNWSEEISVQPAR
jgi:hypothetical protein